jgi:hypothetical protein
MNRCPDVELVLRDYLADDGLTAPDHVLDTVEDRVSRQPQRRTWRLRGRPFMTTYAKLAAGLAAVLVVAVVGWQLLPAGVPGGPPTPVPSVVPTPTPEGATGQPVACENDLTGCAGPLAAGAHLTEIFSPGFEFTTPAGWGNWVALESIYGLSTSLDRSDPILVWSDVRPAEKNADCEVVPAAGVGTSIDDWVTYLTTHPGLIVEDRHDFNLNGAPAVVYDVGANEDWRSPCADDRETHGVAIVKSPLPIGDGYGVGSGARVRLYIVDLGLQRVVVTIYAFYSFGSGRATLQSVLNEAEPIVWTFHWACSPSSPPGPCWGPPDASGNRATPPTN